MKEAAVLPENAITHFQYICGERLADASSELDREQRQFEREVFARGIRPGPGFAAQLAELYQANFAKRARIIIEALKQAHLDFNAPLDDDVDDQLADLGSRTLASAFQALEGGFIRHLQRSGPGADHPSGLDLDYAAQQAAVPTTIRRHLWTLRTVPVKQPDSPSNSGPNVVVNGSVGSMQFGSNNVANVRQEVNNGDSAALIQALAVLRDAFTHADTLSPGTRDEVLADIDNATTELTTPSPDKGKLMKWLAGIGGVVGLVANAKAAYDLAVAAARAFGLPL